MKRILVIAIVAAVLVLVLAAPAWAAAADPPNAWGQHRAEVNQELKGSVPVEIDGDLVNNWGHDLLPYIKSLGAEMGFKNWGQSVDFLKIIFSE